jgi:hypothetical protein
MSIFHLLVLSAVFHTFLKIKAWNKKYVFRVNPSTCSAILKKNPPIVMKLSWRSFLFCLFFTLKFHFLDLFFSNISCCDWSYELYNLKLTVYVILFLQMLCFMVVLAYMGAVGNEFVWDQWEGKKWIHMFIYMYSAIWNQRQMSFILM